MDEGEPSSQRGSEELSIVETPFRFSCSETCLWIGRPAPDTYNTVKGRGKSSLCGGAGDRWPLPLQGLFACFQSKKAGKRGKCASVKIRIRSIRRCLDDTIRFPFNHQFSKRGTGRACPDDGGRVPLENPSIHQLFWQCSGVASSIAACLLGSRSLSSGTGYAFGLIASPIAERLGLSATSINFVGKPPQSSGFDVHRGSGELGDVPAWTSQVALIN
jgi:hypothetical protein